MPELHESSSSYLPHSALCSTRFGGGGGGAMLVMAMSASALCSTRFGGGGGGAMLVMAMSAIAIGMEDAVIRLESDGDSSDILDSAIAEVPNEFACWLLPRR